MRVRAKLRLCCGNVRFATYSLIDAKKLLYALRNIQVSILLLAVHITQFLRAPIAVVSFAEDQRWNERTKFMEQNFMFC